MANQLITHRSPFDYSLMSLMSLMSSIRYTWNRWIGLKPDCSFDFRSPDCVQSCLSQIDCFKNGNSPRSAYCALRNEMGRNEIKICTVCGPISGHKRRKHVFLTSEGLQSAEINLTKSSFSIQETGVKLTAA